MTKLSNAGPIFVLTCLSVAQLLAGTAAMLWAWPLFADSPILSNGASQEISSLRAINFGNARALELLADQREKTNWLFEHYSEGVTVAFLAALCLIFSGVVSTLVVLWLRHADRKAGSRA